jgi:polar amino acid transport system permease protein
MRGAPGRNGGSSLTGLMLTALFAPLLSFDVGLVREYLFRDIVIEAARRTLVISVVAQALGVLLGILAAVARNLKIPVASQLASLYVWFFRGTPLLLQLLFWFVAIPQLAPDDFAIGPFAYHHSWFLFSPFQAALIGLSLNEGAYMAEIVRAGIESIERGQMDASKALGMTNLQAMRLVILPQAVRVIVPPTGNEFIAMLKNSSLASVVSYPELLFVVRGQYARNYKPLELLTVAGIWYLFFTTVFSFLQAELEARLRPEEERKGLIAILQRAITPPGDWTGSTGDRR